MRRTYRSIDRLPARQITIPAQAVVRLAKGNAGNAAANEASVDWRAAAAKASIPVPRPGRGLGLNMLAGPQEYVIESVLPLVQVVLVNGSGTLLSPLVLLV